MNGSSRPADWEILAIALMRKLGGKVELSYDEISEARDLLDPAENQTYVVSHNASQLTPWPPPLTIEIRTRPQPVPEAPDAIPAEIRRWIPEQSSIFGSPDGDWIRRDDH